MPTTVMAEQPTEPRGAAQLSPHADSSMTSAEPVQPPQYTAVVAEGLQKVEMIEARMSELFQQLKERGLAQIDMIKHSFIHEVNT